MTEEIINDAEELFEGDSKIVDDTINVGEFVGDVNGYKPDKLPEPREPIGEFDATIVEAEIRTGEKDGRKWANVNIVVGVDDYGVFPSIVYITHWIGKDVAKFPKGNTKTQTQLFLDAMFTAGLTFDANKFAESVKGLKGQRCRIKSWEEKKRNKETNEMEQQFSSTGYKKYKARFLSQDELPEEAPF